MPTLFDRVVAIDVGTLRVSGLRVAFKIEKTLTREPNTLDLQIFNLSEESRKKTQERGAVVRVHAGYKDTQLETLFTGNVTLVNGHTRAGGDWITRLQAGDGATPIRTKRVSESFASGTSIVDAMKKIADQTGLGLGNLAEEIASGNARNTLTEFSKGYAASGSAYDELDRMARTMGRELSVQDGALQLSKPGVAVGTEVVLLSADTGLIGSPEVAEVSSTGGGKRVVTKARSLIQQRLMPGRKLRLESLTSRGFYRIERVTFTGDTHSTQWYADLELTAL